MGAVSFTLQGRVISKKNSKRLVSIGGGRLIPITSKAFQRWWAEVFPSLISQVNHYKRKKIVFPIPAPYGLEVTFHLKGKLNSDLDNMISSICDLLQEAGIIENDRDIVNIVADKLGEEEDFITRISVHTL